MFLSCSEAWPLDGMNFDTLKEQRAKMDPEDFESDYGAYLCHILYYATNYCTMKKKVNRHVRGIETT